MLPKIIHYVWVGDKPKSELILKCIASWKKYCPDFQIIEWNNNSLQNIDNLYVRQAFEYKKWAFVSDYLRLHALYHFGGFYCDTDLEIRQPLDKFLNENFITGYENFQGHISPITALMGAEKENQIIKDLLEQYSNIPFILNGQMDQTTNVKRISQYFKNKFNMTTPYNGQQTTKLGNEGTIFPSFYFCTPESGKENYSIHHFNGSWLDPYARKELIRIGKYKLVRFKKREKATDSDTPILMKDEIVLKQFNINKKKIISFIRQDRN